MKEIEMNEIEHISGGVLPLGVFQPIRFFCREAACRVTLKFLHKRISSLLLMDCL